MTRWPARRHRIARAALVSVVALATIGTAATLPAAAATQPAQPPAGRHAAGERRNQASRAASAAPFLAAVYRPSSGPPPTPTSTWAQTWTGGTIVGPKGKVISSPYVTRWGELVLGVMAELKIDFAYFPGIMAQIQQESSGNPNAVNAWDSTPKPAAHRWVCCR